MVSLCLVRMRRGNAEDVRRRKDWLDSIGAVLERMLGAEARLWLITSLSSLEFRLRIKALWSFNILGCCSKTSSAVHCGLIEHDMSMFERSRSNGASIGSPCTRKLRLSEIVTYVTTVSYGKERMPRWP